MKKTVLIALAVLLSSAMLFAGGQTETASSSNAPQKLTVLTTAITQNPEGPLFEEYVAEFKEAHPGVEIELSGIPNNQALQQITTLAAGGSLPDIFVSTENTIGALYDMGITEDLTPYMSDAEMADIVDSVVAGSTIDGKFVMYPWYSGPNAVLYRTDWLEEAGVEPPKTLEEMVEVAQAITGDNRYGFGMIGTNDDSGQTRFVMILRSFGARELYQDEDGNWKTEVGTPESVKAFEYFRDLRTKYNVAPPGALENSFNENVNLMAAEQIGMLISGSNSIGKIFTQNPDLQGKLGSVEMPVGVTTFTPVSILGWSLNPESKNKDLAVEFMKFISDKDRQIRWVETTGRMPVSKDALANSDYINTPLFEGYVAASDAMQPAPQASFYPEVKTELGRTYQLLITNPNLDVEKAVKDCQAAIERIIANNK